MVMLLLILPTLMLNSNPTPQLLTPLILQTKSPKAEQHYSDPMLTDTTKNLW